MLETEDLGDIASACNGLLNFSVINQKSMAPCRVLNCGYFGTKSKVIWQVEEELWFFLPFLRLTDGIFYELSNFDVKYLEE